MTEEFLDELISGFLDGELESQELRQLEEILQRDPEAARRLKILQSARNVLAKPTEYHLPDSFAQRVLEAARAEAHRLGLPESHPIRLGEKSGVSRRNSDAPAASPTIVLPETVYPSAQGATGRSWQAISLGVAASLLIGAGSFWWITRNLDSGTTPLPLAGNGSTLKVEPSKDNDSDPAIAPGTQDLPKPETQLAQQSDDSSKMDNKSNKPSPTLSPDTPAPLTPKSPVENIASADTPNKSTKLPSNNSNNPTAPAPINSPEMQSLANAAVTAESLNVLMVVDLELSTQAWNDRAFSKIINEFGIAYEKPFIANGGLVDQLEAGSLVTAEAADSKVGGDDGEVYFVFVQARASRLDNAINEMYKQVEEFPEVYFDLAMDAPCQDILKRLESGTKFEDESEDIFGIATPVTKSADGLGGFASHAPRGKRVAIEQRQKSGAANNASISLNPVSQVLFVLRRPEGADGKP